MGARFTLTLVVVMAAGLSGCFESQRDETFEDTVVLDDVDVRVFNAMADAPDLTLDVDDEARVEALGYGEIGDFSLPANHYRFRVRGDTGEETRATLLDGAQDNLEEDKRYDLILTGRLDNESQQVVLFREDDETFEGETQEERDAENEEDDSETDDSPLEQVRLRAAHLTQGADPMDVYLDDEPGQALKEDREPDATLNFGSRSEPLLVEEDVYRLRLTKAGNQQNVIYDSGSRLDFEIDQDLLLAAVPNTGIDNTDHSVSLVVVGETETTVFRDNDQQGGLQFVHAAAGLEKSVDVTLVDEGSFATGVEFEGVEPGTAPPGYKPSSSNDYEIEVKYTGAADSDPAVAKKNIRIDRGSGLSALLVESQADAAAEDLFVLNNDDRPVVTNARVRAVHAESGLTDDSVDLYLLPSDESLTEDGTVREPWVSGLGYLGSSGYLPVPESTDYKLVVTSEGGTAPGDILLEGSSISLENGGNYRLVIAEDNETADEVQLIPLGGVR